MNPVALHIPDGFLTPGIAVAGWLLAVLFILISTRQTRELLGEKLAPVMGVLAAFIFAAQAINFPIAGGTSGHLLGAALAGILMGPWAGTLIMTAVTIVQGLMFQDGGLLVMGWNILNLGVIPVLAAYATYTFITTLLGKRERVKTFAAFLAAWLSVVLGAVATAMELSVSGIFPLNLSLPSLAGIYALVGLGEGVITAGAIRLLLASRPEVLASGENAPGRFSAGLLTAGLALSLLLVLFSPLASQRPDGLEKVAEMESFTGSPSIPFFEIFPDYSVSFVGQTAFSTIVAMIIGTVFIFALVVVVSQFAARFGE